MEKFYTITWVIEIDFIVVRFLKTLTVTVEKLSTTLSTNLAFRTVALRQIVYLVYHKRQPMLS